MPTKTSPKINNDAWTVLIHPALDQQLNALEANVLQDKAKHPTTYQTRRAAKLLAATCKVITEVCARPDNQIYILGSTLGPAHRHWRRAKFLQQYRLFFRFDSASRTIVLAWVNDDDSLRAYDSKRDAYQVFQAMLAKGTPPDDWDALSSESRSA